MEPMLLSPCPATERLADVIDLSDADDKLDTFLGVILDAHRGGEIDRGDAIAVLAHVIVCAATDNEPEVRRWLESEIFTEYQRRGALNALRKSRRFSASD
jgi:hypothetical protein